MNIMKKLFLSMAALVSIGMMTSCVVNEEDSLSKSYAESAPATVNLRINSGNGSTTRANTIIGETAEKTIKYFTVGLFDESNNLVTLNNKEVGTENATSINTSTASTQIYVAVNSTSNGQFDNKKTVKAFKEVVTELGYTTSADGRSNENVNKANSQLTTGLPMFGSSATISYDANSASNVTVNVKRLVARVGVNNIATDFTDGAYKEAIFVPKEIFMYNVNDKCTWDGTASTSMTETANAKGVCEITEGTSTLANMGTLPNYAYLSSGLIEDFTAEGSNETYLSQVDASYYFYVFPHAKDNPTKLVIKGLFKAKGEENYSTVYYPIIVNKNNGATIAANNTYTIGVTIKGKGVKWPSDDIENASVNVTLTVEDWTNMTQEVTIN